jgi:hypothetical protein
MNRERYTEVQFHGAPLTEAEQKEWHFCWDWDGMLIHKDDPEFECCVCAGGDAIRSTR